MNRFPYLTTALAAMLALSAPVAQAGLHLNGPALDGRQVALPDSLQFGGTPAAELQRITSNSLALDNRRVATPDLAGLWIDHERFPGDGWEIRPMDQRWPDSGRNWLVQD